MTENRHGNGLPEKPTAHQAGRSYDNFIIVKDNKRERETDINTKTIQIVKVKVKSKKD